MCGALQPSKPPSICRPPRPPNCRPPSDYPPSILPQFWREKNGGALAGDNVVALAIEPGKVVNEVFDISPPYPDAPGALAGFLYNDVALTLAEQGPEALERQVLKRWSEMMNDPRIATDVSALATTVEWELCKQSSAQAAAITWGCIWLEPQTPSLGLTCRFRRRPARQVSGHNRPTTNRLPTPRCCRAWASTTSTGRRSSG